MECQTCREALSARLDGEDEPLPEADTDAHLRDCAACRSWQERAAHLSRSLRVREAIPAPDLHRTILEQAPPRIDTRRAWPRLALGGVAVAQIGLALTHALAVTSTAEHAHNGTEPVASHLFNESTAWNLAIGIGLFWAAFRPRTTAGLIPALTGFVVVLLGYSTYDLVIGTAPVSRVASHGLLVAGLALLLLVRRRFDGPERHRADPAAHGAHRADTADRTDRARDPAPPDTAGRHGPLRPTGRRAA